MDHTADVANALADLAQGVSLARSSVFVDPTLRDALAVTPCASIRVPEPDSSSSLFTVCPGNGTAWWQGEANGDEEGRARHNFDLDALLAPAEPVIWASTPSNAVRPILTAHYTGTRGRTCAGAAPLVLRVHLYCGAAPESESGGDGLPGGHAAAQPSAASARLLALGPASGSLRTAAPSTTAATSDTDMSAVASERPTSWLKSRQVRSSQVERPTSWLRARPSVEHRSSAITRCQFDGFLESSALCSLPLLQVSK